MELGLIEARSSSNPPRATRARRLGLESLHTTKIGHSFGEDALVGIEEEVLRLLAARSEQTTRLTQVLLPWTTRWLVLSDKASLTKKRRKPGRRSVAWAWMATESMPECLPRRFVWRTEAEGRRPEEACRASPLKRLGKLAERHPWSDWVVLFIS